MGPRGEFRAGARGELHIGPAVSAAAAPPRRLRLRRRLTVAFLLIAALAAAAVAVSSYLLVRQAWLTESLRRAGDDTRYQLVLAEQFLPLEDPARGASLLDSFARSGRAVVLVAGGGPTPSDPVIDPPLAAGLRDSVAQGELAYQRTTVDGRHVLVVGGQVGGTPAQLYVVYPEDTVYRNLAQLRTVLLAAAAAVTLLAAGVGYGLARRTLEPVGRAAAAARSVAAGRLDTRLPAGRDEFGTWAAAFNQMAAALEAKVAALAQARERERRFTADVAHELRTPVTALVAAASLLRDQLDELPEDARPPARLLVGDVLRLRQLVEELMEVSRLDAGREPLREEEVDLGALVGQVLAAGGWSDQVRVAGAPAGVAAVARTDPRRVARVLSNLVSNALTHGTAPVVVQVGAGADRVRVEVRDGGPGIPAADLPYVFDRFYQADPARASAGSGLGLAIARENARLLGGDVDVRSAAGGTVFGFWVPVTRLLPDGEAADGGGLDDRVEIDHPRSSP